MPKWLCSALEYGIKEEEFWNMSIAELERQLEAYKKMRRLEEQQRASYDYILADLIGRSVARVHSKQRYPEIQQVYPNLFTDEEIAAKKQEKKTELSAIRFKQFAHSFNNRFNKEVSQKNE